MTTNPIYSAALDFAAEQCRRLVAAHPDYVPMYTVGGHWNREGERWTHWCEGFYPGIFWLLHKHTGEPSGATSPSATASRWSRAASIAPFTISAFSSFRPTCAGIT